MNHGDEIELGGTKFRIQDSAGHLLEFMRGVDRITPKTQFSESRFILAHGQEFAFSKESFKGRRAEARACYQNSGRLATASSLTYVEGMVDVFGIPLSHAWTVDAQGRVIDPTLKFDDSIRCYYGVPFKTDYMNRVALKTKVWGLISYTNKGVFSEDPSEFLQPDVPGTRSRKLVPVDDPVWLLRYCEESIMRARGS